MFLFPVLILFPLLHFASASAKRVLTSKSSQEWTLQQFGVLRTVVDKLPENPLEAEAEKHHVEVAVLRTLNELRLDPSLASDRDYSCYISMDDLLDDDMQVVRGGLVVVLQKLSNKGPRFRINFYKTETLRKWLQRNPLDLPVNKFFRDELDVWVIRLIDAGGLNLPLPNLHHPSLFRRRNRDLEDALQTNIVSLTSLLAVRTEARLAIPQTDETYIFSLERNASVFRNKFAWRCSPLLAPGLRSFHEENFGESRPFLQSEGHYFSDEVRVFDFDYHRVFRLIRRAYFDDRIYTIRHAPSDRNVWDGEVLFTIALSRSLNLYPSAIRSGFGASPAYHITPDNSAFEISCATSGRIVARLDMLRPGRFMRVQVYAHADVALMILAASVLIAEGK
eukprot:TRINITY_DN41866_c0_g1_i1.p1 TRINITY_DN41866_c0_g1~~TRINITY_DN41866_c0_g1_i1.p1  ORF type:complete len:393 (+),score=35.05 TRINITY_DN41866_c0_g1_i1:118-1296(+)